MSRCSICDYCQSANSIYNEGLQINQYSVDNQVRYVAALGIDICSRCLEQHNNQQMYWQSIDEEEEYVFEILEEEDSGYTECTAFESDEDPSTL